MMFVYVFIMIFFMVMFGLVGGFGNYFLFIYCGVFDMVFFSLNNIFFWLLFFLLILLLVSLLVENGVGMGWMVLELLLIIFYDLVILDKLFSYSNMVLLNFIWCEEVFLIGSKCLLFKNNGSKNVINMEMICLNNKNKSLNIIY